MKTKIWFCLACLLLVFVGCDNKRLPNRYEIFKVYSGSNFLVTPKGSCVLGGADSPEGSITDWSVAGAIARLSTTNGFTYELNTENATLMQTHPERKSIDISGKLRPMAISE